MSSAKPVYLMAFSQYNTLSQVRGFTNFNGDTYQKHITMQLKDVLTNEQEKQVLSAPTIEDVLHLLVIFGINYTHDFAQSYDCDADRI